LFIAIPQPADTGRAPLTSPRQLWRDVVEGARYLAGWRGALALMGSAMLLNFVLAPSGTLMPLLVTEHFHGDAWMLGWLESGMGVGAIVGGLLLGIWGGFKRRIYTSLTGIVGIGLGIALVGLTPENLFILALAGMSITGMMAPIANGPIHAIMQANIAPEFQGRVFSMIGSLATAMMPLSLLVAAPVAEFLGVRSWFLIGGSVTMVIGVAMFFVPSIRNIESSASNVNMPVAEAGETA
jgi:DHA3 family macrolide efflux protein-like MFS transporter